MQKKHENDVCTAAVSCLVHGNPCQHADTCEILKTTGNDTEDRTSKALHRSTPEVGACRPENNQPLHLFGLQGLTTRLPALPAEGAALLQHLCMYAAA